jgi:2-amino-4-hydroxy-6-hydroxymethyldihydropteridine diphosphokinase
MVPWLAIDPDAELTISGGPQPVARLLAELEPADRKGVRLSRLALKPKSS